MKKMQSGGANTKDKRSNKGVSGGAKSTTPKAKYGSNVSMKKGGSKKSC